MIWNRLFRSRWAALFWSVGICWTAISFVPSDPPPLEEQANSATSAADQAAQMKNLQSLVAKLESQ